MATCFYEANLSSKAILRSTLIRTAAFIRADEFALGLRRWLAHRPGKSPGMLVVEMHQTPARQADQFRRQVEWAARHFTLVDLPTFSRLWQEGRADPRSAMADKPPLLFTFDDGRENNYTTAAPVLESFGTRGVFFVVPEFVLCTPQAARDFYYSHIDVRKNAPQLPEEEARSISPLQIADLSRRGHAVGNHTYSHVNLATLPEDQMHHQIVESARQIADWTNNPVDAFAWTFSWNSITPATWNLIQQHHRFCFAPCSGFVDCCADKPNLIWRTEVEVSYPASEFRFMYAGLAEPLWRSRRRKLKAALNTVVIDLLAP
jgi:peptidoglycan/xylan/chitin deacetylase (PgdA/CDA1 family)